MNGRSDQLAPRTHRDDISMKWSLCGSAVLGAFCILVFCGTAAEADFTIMPLGDSITLGLANQITGEQAPGGYRTRLYSDLHDPGYSFTFVGTSTAHPSPPLSQQGQTQHQGHRA